MYPSCFCPTTIVLCGLLCFVAWHDAFTPLLDLEETSTDFLHKCIRICVYFTAFVYACVRRLRTYTACMYVCVRILRTLCGFCVRIRLIICASCADFAYVYGFLYMLSGFAYVYGLYFAKFDVDCLEGSDIASYLVCFVRENARDSLKVSRIWYWGFRWVLFPRKLLVNIGPSQGSNLEVSVEFFFCARCSLLLDPIKDPILRVLLSYLFNKILVIHRLILPRRFLVDIDRAKYLSWWSNITV